MKRLSIALLVAGSAFVASAAHAEPAIGRTAIADGTSDTRFWLRAGAADALGVAANALPPVPRPASGIVTERKSITALSATELASLRRGFAQMIAWNTAPAGSANFKRSLRYWANIHSFIGPTNSPVVCSPKSGLNYPGMSGITAQTSTTADEQATWCTCQHGTDQFLTWHRMYLYYFEQVLRAAANDPTLRLPFWDYETDGHLPPAYRTATYVNATGATVPNPLYVASRQAQLANGSQALVTAVTSTAGAMPKTSYIPFDNAIEATPHGAVHCATGVQSCPSGYMGYVPTAGNDPIFYSHHANIDRLYECWLRIDPSARLPNAPAQLAQIFSFIDGTGTLVQRKVGDMLTTAQLHYGYAAGGGCPRATRLTAPIREDRPVQSFTLTGPVSLQRGTTTVPLRIAPEDSRSLLSAVVASGTGGRSASLVIEGLSFDEIPAALYVVSLQGANGKRVEVGVINFFNATAPHHAGMAGRAMGAPTETRFDATAALAALGGTANAKLVIEPSTGVTGSSVAQAAERISAKANVRFTSARIEVQ